MATLEVRVTDAPDEDVTAVIVEASDISVQGGPDNAWHTVVDGPVSFDLIAVAGIEEVLGDAQLEPGKYTSIRLEVDSVVVTLNGEEVEATVPSGEVKMVGNFDLVPGETTVATIDFDAERSVVVQGRGDVLFRPTVRLLLRRRGEQARPYVEADTIEPTPRSLIREPGPTPDALAEEFFLEVLNPTEDPFYADAPSIAVSGRSRVDAVVSVNDTIADIDEDGLFEVSVNLNEGPNVIEVVASVESGTTQTSAVLTVFYLP